MQAIRRFLLAGGLVVIAQSAVAQQEITPSPAAAVASTNDGNVPGNAVDNSLATRWSGCGDGAWLKLDLGSTRSVGSVKIAWYNGNTRVSSFDLQTSNDNVGWTDVLTNAQSGGTSTAEQAFDFADVDARWVRYVGHGNSLNAWNSVSEISLFSGEGSATPTPTVAPTTTPTPPAYVEVTPPGSAVTATTNDGNVPGNTVDSSLSTRWSANGDGQWLRLDLGSTHTVSSVKVAFYSGNQRQSRFDLQLSGDGTTWATALASAQSSGTTTALETFDVPDAPARYVRYFGHGNSVNAWNSLTEIEVWAATGGSPTPTTTPVPTATPTATAGPTPTPTVTPTPTGAFRHPGVLVNRAQLDFIKGRVAAGAQPWMDAYNLLKSSSLGSLSYAPDPQPYVEAGSNSNPCTGCGAETNDSRAAYAHALLWYITGNTAHAQKAIQIMNGWAVTFTGGHSGSNGPLMAGWYGAVWPRAAEIIRYTYSGWAPADVDRFETMLRTQYLASTIKGSCSNGNWEAVMVEATMNIAVFLDDRASYDSGVTRWRGRTPAYFYLATDGASPIKPPSCNMPNWYTSIFFDGMAQETCRDFTHTAHGFAALIDAAETALQQGTDLYAEQATRFTRTMEFHAKYQNGASIPSNLCGGSPVLMSKSGLTYEIAYNHFVNRRGWSLPQTSQMLEGARPLGTGAHKCWETLTHYGVGNAGLE